MRLALLALLLLAVLAVRLRAEEVDLELLLLVDVSRSMSPAELEIQRRGYAEALTSARVAAALGRTMTGRIALAYVEWAGESRQTTVRDWTLVTGHGDLAGFADTLLSTRTVTQSRTSIAAALRHGTALLDGNRFEGLRRVIDISGDGPNNQGGLVTEARDAALARGITINGLPLMTRDGRGAAWRLDDLDAYYAHCVIGGPGAFVVPVTDWQDFTDAVTRKLVLEIAGPAPERLAPERLAPERLAPERLVRARQAAAYDCRVGERMWQGFGDPDRP